MEANQVRACAESKRPSASMRKPRQALHLAAVKTHLAHCAAGPRIGHYLGITFTASGVPAMVAIQTPGA